jgi:hypothetical protein
MATSPRRPHLAAAIHGQKDGHAVLDAKICASLFFYNSKVALKPPA